MLQRLGGALEGDDTLALMNVAEPRHGRRAFGAVLGVFAASCLAFAGWLVLAGNPPGPVPTRCWAPGPLAVGAVALLTPDGPDVPDQLRPSAAVNGAKRGPPTQEASHDDAGRHQHLNWGDSR